MDVKITMSYATPEEEWTYLSTKYPTGFYKHNDKLWWFTLVVENTEDEGRNLELTWFKAPKVSLMDMNGNELQ